MITYQPLSLPMVVAPPPSGGDDQPILSGLLQQGIRLMLRPNAIYQFGSALSIPNFAQIEGMGVKTICRALGNNYVFAFNPGNQTRITNLQIDALSAQASGGAIDWTNAASNIDVDHIYLGSNLFIGLNIAPTTGGVGVYHIDRVRWNGITSSGTGVLVGDGTHLVSDVMLTRLWGTASTTADMTRWFSVSAGTDTVQFDNCLFFRSANGPRWQGGTNHKARNVTVDTALTAVSVVATQGLELEDFTVSTSGAGGISLSSGNGTEILGGLIQNCQNDGIDLFGGTETTIIGLVASDNNQANGGTSPAISVAAAVTRFTIADCTLGNWTTLNGHTTHGVLVATGASDFYNVVNNQCPGTTVAGVLDNGTGTHKTVTGNLQ